MFAETLEVVGAVHGDVVEAPALAAFDVALDSFVDGVEILVFFESMVADAFGGRSDGFAVSPLAVAPGDEDSGVQTVHLLLLVLEVGLVSCSYFFAEGFGVLSVVEFVVDVCVEVVVAADHRRSEILSEQLITYSSLLCSRSSQTASTLRMQSCRR